MTQTRVELYQGDCLEVMLTLLQSSVAMVFADLPYGITRNSWDCKIDLDKFWHSIKAISAVNHIACLTANQPFASHIIASNTKQFKYDLIWQKGRPTGWGVAKLRPLRSHEHILVFAIGKPPYNPIMTFAGRKYKTQSCGSSQNYMQSLQTVARKNTTGENYPRTILNFACVNNRANLHPTQKPVALLEWLIRTYTNPSDTVLDPVMGSGTTGVACKRLGRHFIGIEKDEMYYNVAKARIDAEPWPTTSSL